jgi:FemAB-related protein (PEP-CTERM system-associated)
MFNILTHPKKDRWDSYATENGAAKYSHLCAWGETLAATYDLPLFRLAVLNTKTKRLSGILPLMLFNSPGKDSRLISLPYTDAAGILADDDESGWHLLAAALELADTVGAYHLELRQDGALYTASRQHKAAASWVYTPHYFKTGLLRPLPDSVDTLWSSLAGKVRNQVRKAQRCQAAVKTGKIELLWDFYAVFSENMRDLGSPVHSEQLFHNLLTNRSLRTAIIVVHLDSLPVAAAFVLQHNDTLYNPWASSLRSYRPSCPNMLLYWSMLVYAVEQGCRWFDFGRSTPSAPTCRFKMQWGAAMKPLGWHVFSRKPHHWYPGNESLEDSAWKKKDLPLSRQEGPAVRRWISL